jgi:hypothetical protein
MIATCENCQHLAHEGRCPGYPNCGCEMQADFYCGECQAYDPAGH